MFPFLCFFSQPFFDWSTTAAAPTHTVGVVKLKVVYLMEFSGGVLPNCWVSDEVLYWYQYSALLKIHFSVKCQFVMLVTWSLDGGNFVLVESSELLELVFWGPRISNFS